jgi:hypothetical protein
LERIDEIKRQPSRDDAAIGESGKYKSRRRDFVAYGCDVERAGIGDQAVSGKLNLITITEVRVDDD